MSRNETEFYVNLQKRRDQRLEELKKINENLCTSLDTKKNLLNQYQSFRLLQLQRHGSLDSHINFLSSFLPSNDNDPGNFPRSDERDVRNKQDILLILATSSKSPTTNAPDPKHVKLFLPSPPTVRDAFDDSASQSLCRRSTRQRDKKRKHSTDASNDLLADKRQRTDPCEAPENSEANLLLAAEEMSKDYEHAPSPRNDVANPERTPSQQMSVKPRGNHGMQTSTPLGSNSAKGQAASGHTGRLRLNSTPGTRRGNRHKTALTQPATDERAKERGVEQNSLRPRRSARIADSRHQEKR
ncbi:uncharacterized protein FMAN_14215 [Fusarium mangiferae]|uniref:Uncharacterized protein n=1 Tax=Fusarium mangiferae TaxID=192010 RepID=A0A1L7UKX9_FUSMA|nr:uncharacterized protein FMAN_14215 [Fusarium mangiferae]CVL08121.1 uncharacterized protein FMAN_14215 [Fusarium mangiferae]